MYKAIVVLCCSVLLGGCTFLPQAETSETDVSVSGAVDTTAPTNYTKLKAYPYVCEDGTNISVSQADGYLYVFVDTFGESFEYVPETNESGDQIYVYDNGPIYSSLELAGEGSYMYTLLDESTMCFLSEEAVQ